MNQPTPSADQTPTAPTEQAMAAALAVFPWRPDTDILTRWAHLIDQATNLPARLSEHSALLKELGEVKAELAALRLIHEQDRENYECSTAAAINSENKLQSDLTAKDATIQKQEAELVTARSCVADWKQIVEANQKAHDRLWDRVKFAEADSAAKTKALGEERLLVDHFHAVICGVNELLQMCREHFIEAPAMGEWARHCLSAQLKIKHVIDERTAARSALPSLPAKEGTK